MSLGCGSGQTVPTETAHVAWASNPRGTPAMWIRDRLQELFVDADFADWYPTDGRRGLSPRRRAANGLMMGACWMRSFHWGWRVRKASQ